MLKTISILLKGKLETSSSFRALVKSFGIMNLYLNIFSRNPSHTTLFNWVHKIGYYELTKYKEKADDWIIILDESIKIGQEKVMVIFGVREKNIDFIRPLQFIDLEPLRIISHAHWNGELLKKYLEELQKEIGTIKYAIADRGGVITKGLRISEIKHIYDVTHKIAKILEKSYKKDEEYKKITQQMTLMRNQLQQSEIAHIIPPNQRFKSRYHNLKIISDWATRMLNYLEKSKEPGKQIKEHLFWLTEHKIFIKELSEINNVICHAAIQLNLMGCWRT